MTLVESRPGSAPEPQRVPRTQLRGAEPSSDADEERRTIRDVPLPSVLSLVGAAVAGLALMLLLTQVIAPLHGLIPSVAVFYLCFVASYALVLGLDESREAVKDRLATVAVWTLGAILFSVLGFVVSYVLLRGRSAIFRSNFFTQDMANAGPLQGLEVGGILHALVGTFEQIAIALVITIPLGLTCSVFLNEFPGRFARFVRTIVEAMTALPSIVAGLFIYATLILGIHLSVPFVDDSGITLRVGKSGLAAALALSVMMLPIIIRAADVVIRLVPAQLKEASYALGTPRWATVWHVVLPTARSGLTTAVILGTARGIGETSPVLLTAGFTPTMNADPTKGPQLSLPLAVFSFVQSPQPSMIERGFGTAAALMTVVLVLFVVARLIGGRTPGTDTRRTRRRRQQASASDVRRMAARVGAASLAVLVVGLLVVRPSGPASAKESYVPVSGAGSTWSQNAMDQWVRNVSQYGIKINYQGTGSSDGRNQYRNGTTDFAVSEIPYGLTDAGVKDLPPARGYAYMPIVAGGTSFMYNLKIGGQRVTNLRLSGDTLAKMFTGNIRTWNDPQIRADNPGLTLPNRKVVPVVRSDGSGTTAQFATWLSKEHTKVWNSYCASAGRSTPCGVTSFYPVVSGSRFVAQSGSLGVSGFVSQAQNEGTITYVEYSYALNSGFPVVKVLNHAGYYVEPTAENVAVGLLKARINENKGPAYLTQILDGVYANQDRRAYPLSSYSYMIIPTKIQNSFNRAKGYTLGDFAYYFLCEGQRQASALGYSPLPINLVKAGLAQVRKIPGVDVQSIDIGKCNNPTFSKTGANLLAAKAPFPPACDKQGSTQCATGTGGATGRTPTGNGSGSGGAGAGAGGGSGDGAGGSGPGGGGPSDAPSSGPIDPETGQPIGSSGGSVDGQVVAGQSVPLAASSADLSTILMTLSGLVLLLVIAVPPLLMGRLARKGQGA